MVIEVEKQGNLLMFFSLSYEYFYWSPCEFLKSEQVLPSMVSFGERVKNAWKNIYPIQETNKEKKEKKK